MGPDGTRLLLAVACAAALAIGLAVGLIVRAARRTRRGAERRERELVAGLARSQADTAALQQRLEELAGELDRVRQATERAGRQPEYVITSLVPAPDVPPPPAAYSAVGPARAPAVPGMEERVVGALARQRGRSAVHGRAAEAVVRALALAHGVRRALSPEVLDRAAAEAHVARRRSRRDRRREVRAARRVVREVRRNAA